MSDAGKKMIAAAHEALAIVRGEAGPVVLVCGGRDFDDQALLIRTLEALRRTRGIGVVIQGGAGGADSLAANWARMRGIATITYKANWEKEGRKAGPIRNQRMLEEGRPSLVVAFPGGSGTADMVRRSRAVGVEVMTVAHG